MVKIGIIGVGYLGSQHTRILSSLEGVKLAGVYDLNQDAAESIAKQYKTKSIKNPDAFLDLADGIIIATPTTTHTDIAIPFLEAGKAVLIEKPMANTIADCNRIIEAEKRGGGKVLVGHLERFNPAVQHALPCIKSPGFIEIHRLGGFSKRSLDVDVIMDLMIHDIDMILYLTGSKIKSIDAVGVKVLSDHIDIANTRLHLSSGCVVNLTASRISKEKVRKIRIFQKDSYIGIDYSDQRVEIYRVISEKNSKTINGGLLEVKKEEPLRLELMHFRDVTGGAIESLISSLNATVAIECAIEILNKIN